MNTEYVEAWNADGPLEDAVKEARAKQIREQKKADDEYAAGFNATDAPAAAQPGVNEGPVDTSQPEEPAAAAAPAAAPAAPAAAAPAAAPAAPAEPVKGLNIEAAVAQ